MDTPQDLAAVEVLLADRDALHGWIARLDDAGSSVPAAVRARVRDDYERRLDGVTDRLREHADTIASKLAEDRTEHADLLARATSAREALAETELRFAVGEYDQARFDEERNSHASDIESYEVSLTAAAERIARLQDVHALVHRAPRAAEAPVFQESRPVEYLDAAAPPSTSMDDDEPPAIGIGELAPDDADQILAIFDDAGAPQGHDDTGHGALSFRPSGAGIDDHAAMRSAPAHRTPPEPLRVAAPESIPVPQLAPFDEPADRGTAFTDPSGASVARTVRCGECGAMNRPMEWYCEKCGAELTAV